MRLTKTISHRIPVIALVAASCASTTDHYDSSKYSASVTKAPQTASDGNEPGADRKSDASKKPDTTGLAIGATVELTLPDQFDTAHTIGADAKTLILAFSKQNGETVQNYLNAQSEGFLRLHRAVFIMDISSIPVFVRNRFVLPELRKSAFPILLVYEKKMAKALKNKKQSKQIAFVTVEKNVVRDVKYLASKAALAAEFP